MPLTAMTASRKLTFFAIVGVRSRRNITVHDVVGGSAADLNEPYGSNGRRGARGGARGVPPVGAGPARPTSVPEPHVRQPAVEPARQPPRPAAGQPQQD